MGVHVSRSGETFTIFGRPKPACRLYINPTPFENQSIFLSCKGSEFEENASKKARSETEGELLNFLLKIHKNNLEDKYYILI